MGTENEKKQSNWREKALPFLVAVIVWLSFRFIETLIKDKCSYFNCETASWHKIQEIAIDNTTHWGVEYMMDDIPVHLHKSDKNGLSKNKVLERTKISINYVSTRQTTAHGQTIYPERVIEFDDENLWVSSRTRSSTLITSLPSKEVINKFRRVRLGYRDAVNMTWDRADNALSHPIQSISISLSLSDKMQENFSVESIWFIIYYDGNDSISYWIDAQSGKIVYER